MYLYKKSFRKISDQVFEKSDIKIFQSEVGLNAFLKSRICKMQAFYDDNAWKEEPGTIEYQDIDGSSVSINYVTGKEYTGPCIMLSASEGTDGRIYSVNVYKILNSPPTQEEFDEWVSEMNGDSRILGYLRTEIIFEDCDPVIFAIVPVSYADKISEIDIKEEEVVFKED